MWFTLGIGEFDSPKHVTDPHIHRSKKVGSGLTPLTVKIFADGQRCPSKGEFWAKKKKVIKISDSGQRGPSKSEFWAKKVVKFFSLDPPFPMKNLWFRTKCCQKIVSSTSPLFSGQITHWAPLVNYWRGFGPPSPDRSTPLLPGILWSSLLIFHYFQNNLHLTTTVLPE